MTLPGAAPAPTPPRHRTRRRFWLLLLLVLLVCAALFPPAWHASLRGFLGWQAKQHGWTAEIGAIEGGLFDATVLHDFHCRKVFPAPSAGEEAGGVDVRIARVETVFAWRLPFTRPEGETWLDRLTLEGVGGTLDFTSAGAVEPTAARPSAQPSPAPRPAALTPAFVLKLWPLVTAPPANFELIEVNCRVRRGPVAVQLQHARLTAYRDQPGQFLARQAQISGPGFQNTLENRSAETNWKDGSLTLSNLALGPGLDLVRVTFDTAKLRKRQLDWDSELRALGGSVRSQGTVRFSRGRIGLDVAGSLQQVGVRPLARMIGVESATDGVVDQGQFSFRGNPEQWAKATVSLAGQATDFRWEQRRWESLDLAAIVLNGRVTVRKLELRQSRNQLSFEGECALPAVGEPPIWQQPGFTCKVDAKLDDLHSLVQLLGPGLPDLTGRMSVNGSLTGRPQGAGLDGYLNVEGSALTVSGAPLDFLRSTLLFHGEDLEIADVQATRATDYLSGKGTVRIVGAPRYQGEVHAAAADLAVYFPAYAGLLSAEPLQGSLRLNWTGDGAPGAHSGAFRGSVGDFVAKSGPAHFSRPVTVETEGTYSPESLSFRQLALKEGVGEKRRDAIKFEGALPWTRDPAAWDAGRRLDFSRPVAGRALFSEAPLDLIAEAIAAPGVSGVDGLVSGWLDVSGTPEAPHANGVLQFRTAAGQWGESAPVSGVTADVRIEDSVLHLDDLSGTSAGADWKVGGSVDFHQPAHPALDVSLTSKRVLGAVRNDLVRADAEVTLYPRGPWPEAEISGEVRLLDGAMRRMLELGEVGDDVKNMWSTLTDGIPAGWGDERLALHVTAEKALRGALGGEFMPDLTISGTGAAPTVSGRVDLRKAGVASAAGGGPLVVESGTVWLMPGVQPRVDFALKTGGALLGPVDDVLSVPVPGTGSGLDELWREAERVTPEVMWAPDASGFPGDGKSDTTTMTLRWRQ